MSNPAENSSSDKDFAAKELKSLLNFEKTWTDKVAVFIAGLFGSMAFLICCMLFFVIWICWNLNFLPVLKPFDPSPFPILQITVSIFAIILSISVLINQNRQGRIDKISQQVEFEVNVLAESEVTKMLNMLHELHQHLGLHTKEDRELEEMKEPTDISQIHQTLDDREINTIKPD